MEIRTFVFNRRQMYLPLFKLKTFAENDSIVAQMLRFLFDTAEEIMLKGENAGY